MQHHKAAGPSQEPYGLSKLVSMPSLWAGLESISAKTNCYAFVIRYSIPKHFNSQVLFYVPVSRLAADQEAISKTRGAHPHATLSDGILKVM
jgi:hypothetical protein